MKIYYGNELASEIRKNADKLVKRIWVCVPFIGGLKSVSSIIGKEWIDNPDQYRLNYLQMHQILIISIQKL